MIKVTLHGVDELIKILSSFNSEETISEAASDVLDNIKAKLAEYPDPPSGSRYKRTLNLGSAWISAQNTIISNNGFGFVASVTNETPYASLVQMEGGQAENSDPPAAIQHLAYIEVFTGVVGDGRYGLLARHTG